MGAMTVIPPMYISEVYISSQLIYHRLTLHIDCAQSHPRSSYPPICHLSTTRCGLRFLHQLRRDKILRGHKHPMDAPNPPPTPPSSNLGLGHFYMSRISTVAFTHWPTGKSNGLYVETPPPPNRAPAPPRRGRRHRCPSPTGERSSRQRSPVESAKRNAAPG